MNKSNNLTILIIFSLIALDLFIWPQILFSKNSGEPAAYFLDVGQGDSELVVLENGVKIMTDAGPTSKVIASLESALGPSDKYIDLAIISHPQLDHFNGFNDVLKNYAIGAFIVNGRQIDLPEWKNLMSKIQEKKIPLIVLAAGDKITVGKDSANFLSPDKNLIQSGELNDTAFVSAVDTQKFRLMLNGDIGQNVEKYLIKKYPVEDLKADILKVAHHGSKYSSSEEFLKTVSPKLAVIEVGAKNTYGHPTKEALSRLAEANILKTFRTDQNSTIKITAENGKLKVFSK